MDTSDEPMLTVDEATTQSVPNAKPPYPPSSWPQMQKQLETSRNSSLLVPIKENMPGEAYPRRAERFNELPMTNRAFFPIHKCTQCTYATRLKTKLAVHMRMHSLTVEVGCVPRAIPGQKRQLNFDEPMDTPSGSHTVAKKKDTVDYEVGGVFKYGTDLHNAHGAHAVADGPHCSNSVGISTEKWGAGTNQHDVANDERGRACTGFKDISPVGGASEPNEPVIPIRAVKRRSAYDEGPREPKELCTELPSLDELYVCLEELD